MTRLLLIAFLASCTSDVVELDAGCTLTAYQDGAIVTGHLAQPIGHASFLVLDTNGACLVDAEFDSSDVTVRLDYQLTADRAVVVDHTGTISCTTHIVRP